MHSYLSSPLTFLVSTLFSLYILVLMLRFLLQLVQADFYNPLSQFVVRATSLPLRPLQRVLPGSRRVNLPALILMVLLQCLSTWLMFRLTGQPGTFAQLLPLVLTQLLDLVFSVFIYAVIIQAILSWINPGTYNPVSGILHSLTAPLLNPLRRFVPLVGGVDLTPLVALIGLQLLRMLVLPLFASLAVLA